MNQNDAQNPLDALAEAIRTQLHGAIPMPGFTARQAGHSDINDDPDPDQLLTRHFLNFLLSPVGFHVYLAREGVVEVTIPAGSYRLYKGQPQHQRRAWAEGFAAEFIRGNARLFATRALTDEVCAAWLEATTRPLGHFENI